MSEHPIDLAAETISGVLTDLREVSVHLAGGGPVGELETERTARVLDRLSEELSEAAAMVRATR
jgi:hypothetical protein